MTVGPGAHAVAPGPLCEMETIYTMPALRRYIRGALDGGYSLRVALAAFRAAGGKVRTEDFGALWRDERRKREKAAT